jgi:serine protease Do
MPNTMAELSDSMQSAVATAGAYTVTVDARRRIPASGIGWADGVVITAAHTVEREDAISVEVAGERFGAELAGADPGSDVAALHVPGLVVGQPPSGQAVAVGALTLSVARPHGDLAASLGLLSARGGAWRTRRGPSIDGYLRTDATLFPGFSGGPLVDAVGGLLGLNTSLYARGGGFAIPTLTLGPIVDSLLTHGRLRRAFLGIASQPATLHAAQAEQAGQESGLLVVGLDQDGPAQAAGLLVGDIIMALGDRDDKSLILETADLLGALGADRIDVETGLEILRGDERHPLRVTPVERSVEGTAR